MVILISFYHVIKYRTMKQGCPATIKFCLSQDYQKLVVSYVNLDHNHTVGKVYIKGMVITCLLTNIL